MVAVPQHNYAFGVNLPDYDLTDQLPSINCLTLVTVGRHDWITPVAEAEKIAAAVPGAQLVVFGHFGQRCRQTHRNSWSCPPTARQSLPDIRNRAPRYPTGRRTTGILAS